MTKNLNNQVAIVTGASRGIGKAIAIALANQGANVVVASRTKADNDSVIKEIEILGRRALPVICDVRNEDDVREMVSKCVTEFGAVDILINNAGVGFFSPAAEMSVKNFDTMWNTNMRGAFLCTQAVLPHMTKNTKGDIINIASLAGRNAFEGGSGYAATKWALIGFSRCLMLEVRKSNIRVITLCPGSVDTSFGDHTAPKSKGAIPGAEDIAQVAMDALLMPRNVMVSEIDIRPTNPKG